MRVIIIGPCPPPHGGVTRLIDNNTHWWKEWGVESYLVPMKVPKVPEPPAGVQFIDYRKKFSYNDKFWTVMWKALKLHQIYTYHFFKYNVALYNIIQEIKPDIIYAHHTFHTGLSGVLQSKLTGVPCAVVAYGQTWLSTDTDRKFRRMQEEVLKLADYVISTSEHCRRGAISLGANSSRSDVAYAGIDTKKFNPKVDGKPFRQKLGIKDDEIVVSLLGLALRRKIDTFVKALPLLKQAGKVRVLIGGAGKDFDYLKSAVKDLPFVHALGFVDEKDLPSFYAATDVYVMAPETLIECMGQSLKEAMACGITVAGANIGGIPEAVVDKKTGLLFEANNPEDMVEKIKTLIGDVAMRQKFSIAARKVAVEKFDFHNCAKKSIDILKKVGAG